jgi:hypothetical protein
MELVVEYMGGEFKYQLASVVAAAECGMDQNNPLGLQTSELIVNCWLWMF